MSIKISELPQASTVNNTDVIPIVQNGTTKKAPAGLIHPTIATDIGSTSTNDEVAGALAVYNNCLKPESNTPTGIATMDYNQSTFYKVGKVIIATINFHITSSVATNGDIYTSIPYIPLVNSRGMIINTSGSSWCVNIRTDGTIKIMDRNIPSGWYNGFGMYIEEETTTRSLNLTKSANTGELVGLGDRVELTDNNIGNIEAENISQEEAEPIEATKTETKTEGSGDGK